MSERDDALKRLRIGKKEEEPRRGGKSARQQAIDRSRQAQGLVEEEVESDPVAERQAATTFAEDVPEFFRQAGKSSLNTGADLVEFGAEAIEFLSQGGRPFKPVRLPTGEGTGLDLPGRSRELTAPLREAAGSIVGPAVTPAGELGAIAGEEVAGTAIGVGALRGVPRAFGVGKTVFPTGVLRPARQTGARFAAEEAASTTGAIAGRSTAQDDGDGFLGETVKGMAGAVAATGALGLARGALGAALRPPRIDKAAQAKVLREELRAGNTSVLTTGKGNSLSPPAAAAKEIEFNATGNRAQAEQILAASEADLAQFGLDEGFVAGAANPTQGVLTMQAEALGRNPDVMDIVEARKIGSNSAMARAIDEKGGMPGLRGESAGIASIRLALQGQMDQLDEAIARLVPDDGSMTPRAHARKLNQATFEILEQANQQFDTVKNQLYGDISDKAALFGAQFDSATMRQSRMKTLDAAGRFEQADLPPADLMDLIAGLPDEAPWEDLTSLQRRLNGELADPNKSNNQRRLLGMLRDGLSETMEELAGDPSKITFARGQLESPVPGVTDILAPQARAAQTAAQQSELSIGLRNANSYMREGSAIFRDRRTVANKSLTTGKHDKFLEQYLHSGAGSRNDALTFLRTFGDDPQAVRNAVDYMIGEAYRASLKLGKEGAEAAVNTKQLQKWLVNHEELLNIPAFGRVKRVTRNQIELATEARKIGVPGPLNEIEVKDIALKKYLANPNGVFAQIFASPDPAKSTREIIGKIQSLGGDPNAMASFQRRFWDNEVALPAISGGEIRTVNSAVIDKVLANPDKLEVLKMLYGRDHVQWLRDASRTIKQIDRIAVGATSAAEAPDVAQEAVKFARKSGWLNLIAGTRQKAIRTSVAVTQFLREVDDDLAKIIIEESIINPEIGRVLRSAPSDESVKKLKRLIGTAVPSMRLRVDGDEERRERDQEGTT